MAKNVEIKARLTDINIQRNIASRLSKSGPTIIQQEDIFFKTNSGRLKLRIFADKMAELISYTRPDKTSAKTSEYYIYKTYTPDALKKTLQHTLGIYLTVRKKRELYMVGRTRIHIDQVDQLGDFLELEVVLEENEDADVGKQEANILMEKLLISADSLIDKAYVDLLHEKSSR